MKIISSLVLLALLVFVNSSFYANAQGKPNFGWQRSIDSGWSTRLLSVTSSGNIIAASSYNFLNVLVYLTDKGDTLWTLPYGGKGNGGTVIGDTMPVETIHIDEHQGKVRMYGIRLWNTLYDAGWLLKWEINTKGELERSCCDSKIARPSYGIPRRILPSLDGGMYLAGTVTGGVKGEFDKVYFTKTDSNGSAQNVVYNNIKNDSNNSAIVYVRSFVPMEDGGFIIAGDVEYTSSSQKDMFVLRIDSVGNKIWSKNYGTKSRESYTHIIKTNDGGFFISGSSQNFGTGSDYYGYYVKIDSAGTIQWEKSYNEPKYYSCFILNSIRTNDNGFVLVGQISGSNTSGGADCYIVKLDSTGKKIVSYVFGGTNDDFLNSIVEQPNGVLIVGGRMNNKMYVAEIIIPTLGIDYTHLSPLQPFQFTVSQVQNGEMIVRYKSSSTTELSFKLYNSIGTEIQRKEGVSVDNSVENTIAISTEQLATGIYYVQLTDGKNSLVKPITIIK